MPMVGYNLGAKLYDRLIATVQVAYVLHACRGQQCYHLYRRRFILSSFTDDRGLLVIAAPALKIFISTLVLAAPSIV